jgi:nicotinate-nucleotide adenylyltransferase
MTKIGLMGGTFDPPHLGHLAVAEEARRQLDMAEVIFIPAGNPYFKAAALISPAEHRINMLKLALADKPYFKISLLEIERPGPSYAVDTVSRIKEQSNPDDELFFIMGWDSLMTLYRWQEPERLISLCRLVAAPRPGYPRPDLAVIEENLPGISQRALVMDKPLIDISATNIRDRVRQGLPINHLAPAEVASYIREHGLYREMKDKTYE